MTGPDNEKAYNRWKIIGPDTMRVLSEFEEQAFPIFDEDEELFHHQEGLAAQTRFQTQTQNLVAVIESKGNPYTDDFPEMVTLDTRKVLDSSVAEALRSLEKVGTECYHSFKKKVLEDRIVSIDEPIKRNNLSLPKNPRVTIKAKQKGKVRFLQNNVELFGQLYLSHRESDRDEFFSHESGPFPPSISENGSMHFSPSKSDLLKCLPLQSEASVSIPKTSDCVILDGAAIVHFLSPDKALATFQNYAKRCFIPYLVNMLQNCERLDVVFDLHRKQLKELSSRKARLRNSLQG